MLLFSYAKVLFVVALGISSPTSVTATSMHEGAINSHASGAPSSAPSPVPGMTATNHTEDIEERVLENPLLDEISKTLTGLILASPHQKIFECKQFYGWFSRLKSDYPDDLRAINEAIYLAIASHHEDHLSLALAAAKNDNTRHIADIWLGILIDQWEAEEKSEEEVFKLLELDKVPQDEIVESPLFQTWKVFVHQMYSESDAESVIANVISDS